MNTRQFLQTYGSNKQFTKEELSEQSITIKDTNGNVLIHAYYDTYTDRNGRTRVGVVVDEKYKDPQSRNLSPRQYSGGLENFVVDNFLGEAQRNAPKLKRNQDVPKRLPKPEPYKSLSVADGNGNSLVNVDYYMSSKLEGNVYVEAPRMSIKDSINGFTSKTRVIPEHIMSDYVNNESLSRIQRQPLIVNNSPPKLK